MLKRRIEGCFAGELLFCVKSGSVSQFFQFLQRGIFVKAEIGCSVRYFLCRQLELTPEFIENQIKTIFLDGKPVDDIDAATVKDGCTLALSSAMPGLVGATMRRGGYYASFRSQISHHSEASVRRLSEGYITLKLFNIVAWELGAALLEKGILVNGEALDDFLESRHANIKTESLEVTLDGKTLDEDKLSEAEWLNKTVRVRLKIQ